ncbi:MAG: LPS-assembly protein LptD, partial [Sedimentisphaerales bacterium]|nr:LPS-assembly protein LptD [Sedimentisphaerales bacterium]
ETAPILRWSVAGDIRTVTVIGRVDIRWQERTEGAEPSEEIELQADTLVLWLRDDSDANEPAGLSAGQFKGVTAVYVSGDATLTQGQVTVRADELYYDLENKRGLIRNATMRTFDPSRNVPVYIRAEELRQTGDGRYEANDVSVTTSEFHTPQLSLEASKIRIIDRLDPVGPDGGTNRGSRNVLMKGVRFKYYDTTLLRLPTIKTDLLGPTTPLRSIHVGNDSAFGTSVETQWYLSRVLGLREPEGTDSSLFVDYYDKRGPGGGVAVEYERENYFGRIMGYVINDHGEDRLGRTRKNIEVPDELRGRFAFQHRQFLPYGWQLTAELSYLSDRNFLEQFYRDEFYAGKEQETLLHLKRIDDNRALALLTKGRINDFLDEVDEVPSGEYHWTGQSFLDDRFVFFSDSQISRLRYRYSDDGPPQAEYFFTFTETRNEVDMPLQVGPSKIVPYVAGTLGYDDGPGFQRDIDDSLVESEDEILIGEAGVRMSMQPFWRVYPGVESRLWDLHQLRHTIRPSLTAAAFAQSNTVAEQRDVLDLGISQQWQTKRGPAGHERTVDWLDLDLDFVWVSDSGDEAAGPDRLIWNQPFIPLINRQGGLVPPQDRRTTGLFGPQRNYISAAMTWRVSDTMAVMGDVYFDTKAGVVDQLDVGFSRLCWPNLSYFIGSRYLRDIDNGRGEQGSNAVTVAVTYVLDPRYTAVFSQQYDFDYEANIRSDITLIRKYHRVNFALTLSIDESLDEQRVVFSLWPEGVPELSFGLRRYMDLGASGPQY